MKVTCSFCKTNFTARRSGRGTCPICNRKNIVRRTSGFKNNLPLIVFMAFVAAVSLGLLFFIYSQTRGQNESLIISIYNVQLTEDGYIVQGSIKNLSDTVKSIPDIVFFIKNNQGLTLRRDIQLPPSGLIDPKSVMRFVRTVRPIIPGGNSIAVSFY